MKDDGGSSCFCNIQQTARLFEELALKATALISMYLQRGSTLTNEVVHQSLGCRFRLLIGDWVSLDPSREIVTNHKHILIVSFRAWKWAHYVQ